MAKTTIALTTRKPLVRALGMGGRVKREMPQPLYVLNGQLVAHMKRRFRAVRIVDATTVECDLLAAPLAEMAPTFGRLQVNEAINALGGKPFAPATAKASPKAKAAPAKAGKPAKASNAGADIAAVIAAIMQSDATNADKQAAIAALMA